MLFTRTTAHAGTTRLSLQVRPAPYQPGADVLQPGQFYLKLALVRTRTLRKNFEYQECTVIDRDAQMPLQIALLRR